MEPSHRATTGHVTEHPRHPGTDPLRARRREVLDWYASRTAGPDVGPDAGPDTGRAAGQGAARVWPEGAVIVVGHGPHPHGADLAALGCRVAAHAPLDDWRRQGTEAGVEAGAVERAVPPSAGYVLVTVAREAFDLRFAGDVVALGHRTGLPVGTLPARSAGELGFMLRRMALARRARAGAHVFVDAADSSSVVGDAAELAAPGSGGVRTVSVYGHGNESHVKVGDRFVCAHSTSGFPGQDCACAPNGLRLCRLDDIRCGWIHLGSCGALIPDWRRSRPATNFVDAFASSYAATLCGSLYRMPTSRRAILVHELAQLGGAAPGGDDRSAGTLCLGDPVLLRHRADAPDRTAAVASLGGELGRIEAGSARLAEDRARLLALTRTVEDARGVLVALRLAVGPAGRGALDACARGLDGARGWAVRAAAVLSAASGRTLYGEPARAEFARCVAGMESLGERFARDLVAFLTNVPEDARADVPAEVTGDARADAPGGVPAGPPGRAPLVGARAVERAMRSGLLFEPQGPDVLCACRLCGLPVRVGAARGAADDRECRWARCDVCGDLARSPDGERFPLVTVAGPGAVGVRFFDAGTRPGGPRPPGPAARVVVDVDDGSGALRTRSAHVLAAGGEVRVRCDTGGAGPSLRVRALAVSGFVIWFARATVPSAELLGAPPPSGSPRHEGGRDRMRGTPAGRPEGEGS
ncbi:hypothetical protein AB0467_06005 [Streptomyces sp. NPDC052095]|uniref:hypothetical protein n=1 Tax=unclassified Streptomyces TaxID=2593676 RepID=UPI0034508D72